MSSDSLDVRDVKVYKARFFYNSRVLPSKVDALLARKRHKCEVSSSNTVRSQVFSKKAKQVCNTSLDAGQLVCKVAHTVLSHPNVHSSRGIGDVTTGNDLDAVISLSHNPVSNDIPGFESGGHGFVSPTNGSSGCVSRDVLVAKPNGHGFESSQATDCVTSKKQEGKESCKHNGCSEGDYCSTLPENVGLGFDSCVKENIGTTRHTSVNAVTKLINCVQVMMSTTWARSL